jgi:uncharacterized protein YqeY
MEGTSSLDLSVKELIMLVQRLKQDKLKATKAKDTDRKNAINMILGEIPRLNKTKDEVVTDEEIITIVNKLIKSELIMLEYDGVNPDTSLYVQALKSYLPKMMDEKEIFVWILDNISLDDYNVPMQAMKDIMKNLKGRADGALVKNVLTRIYRN